jgi:hypothetical protein
MFGGGEEPVSWEYGSDVDRFDDGHFKLSFFNT